MLHLTKTLSTAHIHSGRCHIGRSSPTSSSATLCIPSSDPQSGSEENPSKSSFTNLKKTRKPRFSQHAVPISSTNRFRQPHSPLPLTRLLISPLDNGNTKKRTATTATSADPEPNPDQSAILLPPLAHYLPLPPLLFSLNSPPNASFLQGGSNCPLFERKCCNMHN